MVLKRIFKNLFTGIFNLYNSLSLKIIKLWLHTMKDILKNLVQFYNITVYLYALYIERTGACIYY